MLIEDLTSPGHDSSTTTGARFQVFHPSQNPDGVSWGDWVLKRPFEKAEERQGRDFRGLAGKPAGNGETEQTVGYWPPEWSKGSGLVIHVQSIVIPGQAGEIDHISFGDRTGRTFPLISDDQVLEL